MRASVGDVGAAARSANPRALPSATFAAFRRFLDRVAADPSSPANALPTAKSEFDQVVATARALDLIGPDLSATLLLRRLARGDVTLLDVLTDAYGPEAIACAVDGTPWPLGSNAAGTSLRRAAAMIRGAVREAGQPTARKSSRRSSQAEAVVASHGWREESLVAESRLLLGMLSEAVAERRFEDAAEIQGLLREMRRE